ncbi:MAG: hypothetical protein KTR16_04990 [Acidiferrobacterales bacterium]|nr:hypothetical protein [Acidiferrobacterales bacterium]
MNDKQVLEQAVSCAVREFAESIGGSSKVFADFSPVIEATSLLPLANLEYWERRIRDEYYRSVANSHESRWKFWSNKPPPITWIDLCSGDGHRRERALRTIGDQALNRFFLALVLRRLNDWVPQVRAAAIELLPDLVKQSNTSDVADVIFFTLCHWSSWERIDDSGKEALLSALSDECVSHQLKVKLISSSAGPLCSVLSQVGRTNCLDNSLVSIAQDAVQPTLRAKAYRCLFEKRISWVEGRKWEWTDIRYCEGRSKPIVSEREISVTIPFQVLLHNAANDNSSIVRRVAAEMLITNIESAGKEAPMLAQKFASDTSSAVAERGKYALRKLAGETLF